MKNLLVFYGEQGEHSKESSENLVLHLIE